MSTISDIFQNWKNNKFVTVPAAESGLDIDSQYPHLVVLADVGYWNEHLDQLREWCAQNGCEQKGMTVALPNDQTLLLFCLRWS
jgi:hypothetical protein